MHPNSYFHFLWFISVVESYVKKKKVGMEGKGIFQHRKVF